MRSLLLHANEFKTKINGKSNKPYGIVSEKTDVAWEKFNNGLVVFFCVENGDTEGQADQLYSEIIKTIDEVKTNNVMLSPFVHLSKNIAGPEDSKKIYEYLLQKMSKTTINTSTSRFGYHKSLNLDIKGHPGSFRYREF